MGTLRRSSPFLTFRAKSVTPEDADWKGQSLTIPAKTDSGRQESRSWVAPSRGLRRYRRAMMKSLDSTQPTPFHEVVHQWVLGPLAMTHTGHHAVEPRLPALQRAKGSR